MPVTTLSREVTATSQTSPEEAVRQAVARVTTEIDEVEHVEIKRVEVLLQDTNVSGYCLTLEVIHGNDAEPTTGREIGSHRASSRHHPPDPERFLTEPLPLGPEPVPLRIDEDGVAQVGQTRVTLDTVVADFRLEETAEGIVKSYPTLRLADVYRILGYYLRHHNAVDAYVAGREREASWLRQEIEANLNPTGVRARLLLRTSLRLRYWFISVLVNNIILRQGRRDYALRKGAPRCRNRPPCHSVHQDQAPRPSHRPLPPDPRPFP